MVCDGGADCRSIALYSAREYAAKKRTTAGASEQKPCPCQPPCQFRFAVYGDTRYDDKAKKTDDKTIGQKIHKAIVRNVATYDPLLILQTGDLVQYGDKSDEEWKEFDKAIEMRGRREYYPAPGNHDKCVGSKYVKYMPEKFRPVRKENSEIYQQGDKLYYAFDKENVRFIAIDTVSPENLCGMSSSSGEIDPVQKQWLEDELKRAEEEHKFAIPFFHHAIYSIGQHGGNENSKLREILEPLFKDNVRLVFQGHDHLFYYTQFEEGITYVVSGGGGATLYDFNNINQRFPAKHKVVDDWYIKAYNFSVCDMYPEWIEVKTYTSSTPLKEAFKLSHEFVVRLK